MSELSRIETLLGALVDGETVDVIPQSRIETYLLALLNGDTEVKEPQSRIEAYLYQLCKRGMSGGGITSTGLVYELAEPVTFNGTSDYIDTGVKLYDTDKDFLIWLEFEEGGNNEELDTLLHCMYEASPWQGVTVNRQQGGFYLSAFGTSFIKGSFGLNGVIRLAIAKLGNYVAAKVTYDGLGEPQTVSEGTIGYQQYDGNLLLGAYQTIGGTKDKFWSGTINDCKVFVGDELPTDELTNAFLMRESTPDDEPTGLVYELAETKQFNGTSDYIDTGVKLYNTDKDFAVLMEFIHGEGNETGDTFIHCMTEVNPYNGMTINIDAGGELLFIDKATGQLQQRPSVDNDGGITRLAIIKRGSTTVCKTMHNGLEEPFIITGDIGYVRVNKTLILGAYKDESANIGRHWNGTISKCKVYVQDLLTDEETTAFLIGE